MAKIVPSPLAPSEPFRVTTASGSVELDGSKKTSAYETDDIALMGEARVHPWLEVQTPKADVVTAAPAVRLDPTKDPLSAQYPDAKLAFDAEAARQAQPESVEVDPIAVDAGLDQDKEVKTGEVAETLAAADRAASDKTSKEKK